MSQVDQKPSNDLTIVVVAIHAIVSGRVSGTKGQHAMALYTLSHCRNASGWPAAPHIVC